MKNLIGVLAILSIMALLAPAPAAGFGIEGALGGWMQTPQGQIAYEDISADDELDIEDDLNYDDETRAFGRLKIDLPLFIPNVYLMYTPMSFEAEGQKSVDFNFGDETFNADEPFDSKLTLDHFDVGLYYSLPFLERATAKMLNVEIGLNVRIIDFEAEIKQTRFDLKESESGTLPLPMLYLGAQFRPFEWLALEGEGRGIGYNDDAYYSLIGRLRFNIWGGLFAAGGYRYDRFDYDEDDFDADVAFGGPFLEAGFSF